MDIGPPETRQKTAFWTVMSAVFLSVGTYFFGLKNFSFGLVFGVSLSLINLYVVGWIFKVAFRRSSKNVARAISFVGYHVRFWILVIVLFLVIPKTHYHFAIGTFAGVVLPKAVMAVFLLKNTEDEWWNKRV